MVAGERETVVRAAFAAWARGDESALFELMDPDAVLLQFPEQADARPYRGHEGFREMTADWIGTWEDYSIDLLGMREVGEDVVAAIHQSGRGRASGIEMDADTWFVITVRDGRIVRWRMFSSEEEAVAAAD